MLDHTILLDTWPRTVESLFDPASLHKLESLGRVVVVESREATAEFTSALAVASVVIGQPDLPTQALQSAPRLRSVINVEGNFFPNVDYDFCFRNGISVLSIAPAFALPVAEMAVGLAIDLARGITAADAEVRAGVEEYGSRGNTGAFLLSQSKVGIIGYGAIGRAIRRLLTGFATDVLVHDPWLPASVMKDDGCRQVDLDSLLSECSTVFVAAAVTSLNLHLLGRRELSLLRPNSCLILVSRAGVVDFEALIDLVNDGRFRAATDVFPVEPILRNDRVRTSRLLLSPHRAGGMRAAMVTAAEMIIDDVALILRGLPPARLLPARRETIGLMRSPPASYK